MRGPSRDGKPRWRAVPVFREGCSRSLFFDKVRRVVFVRIGPLVLEEIALNEFERLAEKRAKLSHVVFGTNGETCLVEFSAREIAGAAQNARRWLNNQVRQDL